MRKAKLDDIDDLYEIYMDESVNPYMAFDPSPRSEFASIFEELCLGGDLLVFEESNEIVGVCKIIRRKLRLRHVAYIGSLAVTSSKQGKGIGKRIMTQVLDMLQTEGFKRIELFVASDNIKTIGFFKSFGFEIEGTLRSFFSREGSDKYFNEHIMALLYE